MRKTTFSKSCLLASAAVISTVVLAANPVLAKTETESSPNLLGGIMSGDFKTKEAGDWNIRLRGVGVYPFEKGAINSATTGASLGLNAELLEDYIPELDISYFLTKNVALELVLGTSRHQVNAVPTAGGAKVPVGNVSLLPPTLTLQYHFLPESRISPYIGAGLNYTIFYNEDAAGGTITSTAYEDSFGYALQAGVDVALTGGWSFNLDFKKIFLDTTLTGTGTVGPWTTDVDLDPIFFGFGFGYRF